MSETAITTEYKEVLISDLFTPKNGSSTYTKEWCQDHNGDVPLYSGNTVGPFDYIDIADYDGEYITWAKDGLAGYTMYHNEKFSLTGHRGILIPKGDHRNLDVQYMRLMIEPLFRKNIKGRLGIDGKNEYTTLNASMINGIKEKIKIPIKSDGTYDLGKQKEIALLHLDIMAKEAAFIEKIKLLKKCRVEINSDEEQQYRIVRFNDIFELSRGKIISKPYILENAGDYPVYSTQKGVYGHINSYMREGHYLLWNTDGLAGYIKNVKGRFSFTNIVGIMIPTGKIDMDSISLEYLKCYLEPIFRKHRKGRMGVNGKNEYTKLNSTMIKQLDISIPIPVKADGNFDLEKQKELAQKYATIETIKESIYKQIETLTNIVVV